MDYFLRFAPEARSRIQEAVAWAEDVLSRTERRGFHTIYLGSDAYPALLSQIPDPPLMLFAEGDVSLLSDRRMFAAVVGTRKPTELGIAKTQEAVRALVGEGFVIVSGLALGIDAVAHKETLDCGGLTIAVLPGPLDDIVPKRNRRLAEAIVDSGGLLLTECPLGEKPARYSYVRRDRIQAGLADVLFAIEAGANSGTLHTVGFSRRYGRPVFCPEEAKSGVLGEGVAMLAQETATVAYDAKSLVDKVDDAVRHSRRTVAQDSLF